MILNRLIGWYGKRVVYGTLALIVVLLGIAGYLVFRGSGEKEVETPATKQVEIRAAGELDGGNTTLPVVGTVRAVSEARLLTEAGGRVTAVNVAIGDRVSPGQILATIENASERAAVLQAEGVYESALAGGAQASIGLREAETGAQNAHRAAHTVSDTAIRNLTDELFSNPDGATPGIRLDAEGNAVKLNQERVAIGDILDAWDDATTGSDGDPLQKLNDAEANLTRISNFISDLSLLVSNQEENAVFTEEVLSSYKGRFLATRSSIDGTLSAISGARSALLTARESATGAGTNSDADARIKQALGSLRFAQASYEKTLVRSPIGGVVNAMYLKANEYVNMNAPAAVVANNNALEITTSIGEDERTRISIGGKVLINDMYEGVVVKIAPAVDPQTGKIEVKVSASDEAAKSLSNGTTVSLSIEGVKTNSTSSELRLPLRAVKITPQGPSVFIVENDTLKSVPITLGSILGEVVIVESGLEAETKIVTDARGLKDGEVVKIMTN